ncbi:MAG: hypothetical protein NQU48_03130 [Hadesarchaea archaeon]|jgi:late competence protein required for DNA uptake (superfamily II DNA/RNA helicase)|nr:hypothetical protein [Hadesarchaea archaeon]TDA32829.1 MAG: hypothetical protein DSO04_01620 [Hadesarchaea archaeon]
MTSCSVCGKPVERGVRCSTCGATLHRECAKKILGKFYCRKCYREGRKEARYERMRQWGVPGRT